MPGKIQASLTIVDGPGRGQVFPLSEHRTVIGRKSGDIVLKDSKISSTHAALEWIEGSCVLFDLGSTNGTYVNGKQIVERRLKPEDQVRLGFTTLLYRMSKPEEKLELVDEDLERRLSERPDFNSTAADKMDPDTIITDGKQLFICLKILSGPEDKQSYRIASDSVVIGRVNADVTLKSDPDVSRKHAIIEVIPGGQIFLRDLASASGTLVNGRRVKTKKLSRRDEIKIGRTVLLFNVDLERIEER